VLPTIDLAIADPECDLDYVATGARKKSVRVLVKNGFGAGGVSSVLVFRRDEPSRAVIARKPSSFEEQFAF
jgi:3-oxoacyl-(acyl-carrier-protein) synthase